jgi:ABC-type multidrug transport system fused ATPase/permease subunit
VDLLQLPETNGPRNAVHSIGRAEVGGKLSQKAPVKQELQSPVRIMLKEVCYRYRTRDRDALTNVSFEIAPGSRVALVGPSGAGKSTLFSVLLRLVEPTSGRMLGNGLPAVGYDIEAWRAEFGFVPQADHLVSGTVADNISYGVPHASRQDIEAAAELAFASVFIETLPAGYDTDIGEVGLQLSVGQRQRINLSRAILRRPSIYLLDEATSSLDPESEKAVQVAIDELAKTSTVFVIAHRLHTVRNADQILVMNNGVVVDMGDHAALAGREPLYQSLIRAYRQ